MIWSIPTMWQFPELFLIFLLMTRHKYFPTPGLTLLPIFPSFRPMGMVGKACLPSNAYYPRTPDYTLYSGVHVCWSKHSDSSFVYGFMSLDYGLGTMTAITSDISLFLLKKSSTKLYYHRFLCFRFDALTELGTFMRTEFLCVSVLREASGPMVKLASCKSALTPPPHPQPPGSLFY